MTKIDRGSGFLWTQCSTTVCIATAWWNTDVPKVCLYTTVDKPFENNGTLEVSARKLYTCLRVPVFTVYDYDGPLSGILLSSSFYSIIISARGKNAFVNLFVPMTRELHEK
jgi:hypothetical protein